MLQLKNIEGKIVLIITQNAFDSLYNEQKDNL